MRYGSARNISAIRHPLPLLPTRCYGSNSAAASPLDGEQATTAVPARYLRMTTKTLLWCASLALAGPVPNADRLLLVALLEWTDETLRRRGPAWSRARRISRFRRW